MTTITLTVDRRNLLTANQRKHRMAVANSTKILRHAAALNARSAHAPIFTVAHVTVHIAWPDRRRRDRLNIAPTIKACIDGFTDAELWADDDDTHILGPDFRTDPELSGIKGVTRLTFVIEEVA